MSAERMPGQTQDSEPRHLLDLIYTDVHASQIPSGITDRELRAFAAKAVVNAAKDTSKTDFFGKNMASAIGTLLTFGRERQLPYINRQVILVQLQALAQGEIPNPCIEANLAKTNPKPPSFTELENGLLENAGGIMKNTEKMVAILSAIYEKNCKDADFISFRVRVSAQREEEILLTSGNLVDYTIRMALNQVAIDTFASGRSAKRGHADPTCRTSGWCKHT